MYTMSWKIIRDDAKRTFEVQGQESNIDHFMNLVHGMQKTGMTVTAVILPVTNRQASKEAITQIGYSREEGLYDRLMKEYRSRMSEDLGRWEE
jgi:hypothetical protein